ncbi:hypothetical protein POTOM_012314 [Populus tomentosa]|uniref:PH domain-containing protein n=1 Tax=Populus tomentosa TaxID=118781 RepID=A0A8X8D8Z3_POPTO|nr:hypothetical protein POTOM_012314 [Populus tomentosa]
MDDSPGRLNIIPDHFQFSTTGEDTQTITSSTQQPKLIIHPGCHGVLAPMVELSVVELEALRSELAYLEEREAHLKAQLQHVDVILRSARFSGYLYIRTRWTALPGEPPPLDDTDVDDWLPRFVVLNGPCIFFYLLSTDLSPQDSTLLSDIVEVGSLPSLTRESDQTWHSFYILTRQGLRYECSSISEVQVDSWLKVLQTDIKSGSETKAPNGSRDV